MKKRFWKRNPKFRFCIKLAGFPIEINVRHSFAEHFCREYLTDEKPELTVSVCRNDIISEKRYSRIQRKSEALAPKRFSAKYLEILSLYRKITAELLPRGVLLFHGSVVAADGKAYIFTAKSGTGKTTHCNLWLKNFPNCRILNGDKPLLLFKDSSVYVCGTPWQGKENLGTNEILPLGAICFLERGETNHIERTSFQKSFDLLIGQCHIPEGNGNFAKVIHLLQNLSSFPMFRLACNTENKAALISYQAMVQHQQ